MSYSEAEETNKTLRVEDLRGTEGPVDLKNVASSAELDEESQPFRTDFEAFEVILFVQFCTSCFDVLLILATWYRSQKVRPFLQTMPSNSITQAKALVWH